jgi:phosphoribosylanthranilate isomerase|tara:strand:+ start:1392 stop:2009 length:618 start_codon:yes stop_codon:yes gene_type:complete
MSVAVKICGITDAEQAKMVEEAGADAIGVVLYENSSRYVDLEGAIEIKHAISGNMLCIALVVNATAEFIHQIIERLAPDLIQFHGDESPEFCDQFDYPYIRAIRMHGNLTVSSEVERYQPSGGFLFDAWHADQYGGTGEKFDWHRLPKARDFRLILAGGLSPDNVAVAIRTVAPDMVDVSGGVESAAGIKDQHKVVAFIDNAKST